MSKRGYRRHRQGFTLIEVILAIVLSAITIGGMLTVTQTIGKASTHQAIMTENISGLDQLADEMQAAASSAIAVYAPTSCMASGGHTYGAAGKCQSVMFLQSDVSGASHRWGWVYDPNAHVVVKCTAFGSPTGSDYDTTCAGATSTQALDAFTVQPVLATQLASQFGISGTQDVKKQMDSPTRDPSGFVVAGNQIMQVAFAKGGGSRSVDLIQGGTPLSVAVITHQNQSPAVGGITGPNPITTLPGPTNAETYSAQNYNQYAPYLGANGGWSVSPCVSGNGGAATTILTGTGGDNASVSVTGVTPGTCTFNVTNANGSYAVSVSIQTPATPTPAPTAAPTAKPVPTATPIAAPTNAPTVVPSAAPTTASIPPGSIDPCQAFSRTCLISPPNLSPNQANYNFIAGVGADATAGTYDAFGAFIPGTGSFYADSIQPSSDRCSLTQGVCVVSSITPTISLPANKVVSFPTATSGGYVIEFGQVMTVAFVDEFAKLTGGAGYATDYVYPGSYTTVPAAQAGCPATMPCSAQSIPVSNLYIKFAVVNAGSTTNLTPNNAQSICVTSGTSFDVSNGGIGTTIPSPQYGYEDIEADDQGILSVAPTTQTCSIGISTPPTGPRTKPTPAPPAV